MPLLSETRNVSGTFPIIIALYPRTQLLMSFDLTTYNYSLCFDLEYDVSLFSSHYLRTHLLCCIGHYHFELDNSSRSINTHVHYRVSVSYTSHILYSTKSHLQDLEK